MTRRRVTTGITATVAAVLVAVGPVLTGPADATGSGPAGSAGWAVVAAGGAHACAIDEVGALWCWGGNGAGAVGDGTQQDRLAPVAVAEGRTWASVAAADANSC